MTWRTTLLMLAPPAIMGPLSILGWTGWREPFLWLGFAIAAGILLDRGGAHRLLGRAALIGVGWGVLNGAWQSTFFALYLANNPAYAEELQAVTFMRPRLLPIVTGPAPGLFTAPSFFGCLDHAARWRERESDNPEPGRHNSWRGRHNGRKRHDPQDASLRSRGGRKRR